MEPNKFDQKIKQKLDSRTIAPSAQTWDRLESMLDAAEKTKTKSNFRWVYFAASFVGLALVTTIYFNSLEKVLENPRNKVVEKNSLEKGFLPNSDAKISAERTDTKSVIVSKSSTEKTVLKTKRNLVAAGQNSSIPTQLLSKKPISKAITKSENNVTVNPESLPEPVENDKKSIATATIKVDAVVLLSKAETELNQSFKESAFDRLNKNFKTIKTVFTNRNYEE